MIVAVVLAAEAVELRTEAASIIETSAPTLLHGGSEKASQGTATAARAGRVAASATDSGGQMAGAAMTAEMAMVVIGVVMSLVVGRGVMKERVMTGGETAPEAAAHK